QIANSGIPCLLIDRTPAWSLPDRLTVQQVPPHIYGVAASYPAWIFHRDGLLAPFRVGSTLSADSKSRTEIIPYSGLSGEIDVDGELAQDSGFCIRIRRDDANLKGGESFSGLR